MFQEEEGLEVGSVSNISHHSIMYAPKCLVLVSRLDYFETFKVRYNSMYNLVNLNFQRTKLCLYIFMI